MRRLAMAVMIFVLAGMGALPQTSIAQDQNWQLTFSEEFSGTGISDNWELLDPYGGFVRNNENDLAYTNDEQTFRVQDGVLSIIAHERPAEYDGQFRKYTSGIMSTKGRFSQLYGAFEVRFKAPQNCQGAFPAVWLAPESLEWPPEIDVVEHICKDPNTLYFNNHFFNSEGELDNNNAWTIIDSPVGEEFHTVTMIWDPDAIVWLLDGQEVHRATTGIPDQPMFPVITMVVGGNWAELPDETTKFPVEFQVDYFRIWQRV